MNPAEFTAVDVDYAAIAPMLVVAAGALVGVLVEAFALGAGATPSRSG